MDDLGGSGSLSRSTQPLVDVWSGHRSARGNPVDDGRFQPRVGGRQEAESEFVGRFPKICSACLVQYATPFGSSRAGLIELRSTRLQEWRRHGQISDFSSRTSPNDPGNQPFLGGAFVHICYISNLSRFKGKRNVINMDNHSLPRDSILQDCWLQCAALSPRQRDGGEVILWQPVLSRHSKSAS